MWSQHDGIYYIAFSHIIFPTIIILLQFVWVAFSKLKVNVLRLQVLSDKTHRGLFYLCYVLFDFLQKFQVHSLTQNSEKRMATYST